jgi:hypothetical protein
MDPLFSNPGFFKAVARYTQSPTDHAEAKIPHFYSLCFSLDFRENSVQSDKLPLLLSHFLRIT